MKVLVALLVACLAVIIQGTPVLHGDPQRLVIHDPTGHTVIGGGDENRDFVPDAADTNRDGKADAVVYPVPAYHHVPVYHSLGVPVAYPTYHGGYFPYHAGYYGAAGIVH